MAWKYVSGELRVELPRTRKLKMRCPSVEEAKRIFAASKGAEQIFFWLAAETGMRAGEIIALRASDVDLENLSVEVTKAIWGGEEDEPKTDRRVSVHLPFISPRRSDKGISGRKNRRLSVPNFHW